MTSRSARRIAGVALLAAILFVFASGPSRRESDEFSRVPGCGPVLEPCTALLEAELAFHGEVLGAKAQPRTRGSLVDPDDQINDVRFRIVRAFKGSATEPEWSGLFHETSLAHRFQTGERVVVYARQRRGHWETTCGRTRTSRTDERAALERELSLLAACRLQ